MWFVIFLLLILAGGCLFGRQSVRGSYFGPSSLSIEHAQAISSVLISSRIPYDFAVGKPLCRYRRWEGQHRQASCAVSSSPLPMGPQCRVEGCWQGFSCESCEKLVWWLEWKRMSFWQWWSGMWWTGKVQQVKLGLGWMIVWGSLVFSGPNNFRIKVTYQKRKISSPFFFHQW